MPQTLNDWLPILALVCLLPTLIVLIFAVWAFSRGQKLLAPSLDDLQRQFDAMKARHPQQAREQLVAQIIQRQALRSGLVGAVTSVGGVLTLPFGLAIDLVLSARIQNATLHFLAWAYGRTGDEPVLRLNQALTLRESDVMNRVLTHAPGVSQRVTTRIVTILVEKTIAKLIPGIGLIVGFGVNYALARGTSWLAAKWYQARAGR